MQNIFKVCTQCMVMDFIYMYNTVTFWWFIPSFFFIKLLVIYTLGLQGGEGNITHLSKGSSKNGSKKNLTDTSKCVVVWVLHFSRWIFHHAIIIFFRGKETTYKLALSCYFRGIKVYVYMYVCVWLMTIPSAIPNIIYKLMNPHLFFLALLPMCLLTVSLASLVLIPNVH